MNRYMQHVRKFFFITATKRDAALNPCALFFFFFFLGCAFWHRPDLLCLPPASLMCFVFLSLTCVSCTSLFFHVLHREAYSPSDDASAERSSTTLTTLRCKEKKKKKKRDEAQKKKKKSLVRKKNSHLDHDPDHRSGFKRAFKCSVGSCCFIKRFCWREKWSHVMIWEPIKSIDYVITGVA